MMEDPSIYLSGPMPRLRASECECPWCGVWVKKPEPLAPANSCDCKVGGVTWDAHGCGVTHPDVFLNVKITE